MKSDKRECLVQDCSTSRFPLTNSDNSSNVMWSKAKKSVLNRTLLTSFNPIYSNYNVQLRQDIFISVNITIPATNFEISFEIISLYKVS